MAEIHDLLVTDASNIGRWPENMPFSGVNDAGRADEGIFARWYKDTDGSITASGSANAFAITSNRTIPSLFNNLVMAFTANFSITGAATLNLNGIGAKGIKRFNGTDLASGDIISGQPILVVYKSTPDVWYAWSALPALTGNTFADYSENASPGNPAADTARLYAFDDSTVTRMAYRDSAGNVSIFGAAATQAQMEAASSAVVTTTPGRQQFHPGHPKAGGAWNGQGVVALYAGDYGLAAVSDDGTGLYTASFDTAFSSTTYWAASWVRSYSAFTATICHGGIGGTKTTSAFQVRTAETTTGNAVDPTEVSLTFLGDYP
jgi:hypothetical protein